MHACCVWLFSVFLSRKQRTGDGGGCDEVEVWLDYVQAWRGEREQGFRGGGEDVTAPRDSDAGATVRPLARCAALRATLLACRKRICLPHVFVTICVAS